MADGSGRFGNFEGVPAGGQFVTSVVGKSGDSGGAASVDVKGVSYIVGIDSGGGSNGTLYSYLSPNEFARVMNGVPSSANGDFSGMAPDLEIGSSPNDYLRGTQRRADIITNGDNNVILAGGSGDVINTGTGSNDIVFLPSADGNSDSGTTVVISPGTKTIVGATPEDRLVIPADRLWSVSGGMPKPSSSGVSSTIQLTGGAYYDFEGGDPQYYTLPSSLNSANTYSSALGNYDYGVEYDVTNGGSDLTIRFSANQPKGQPDDGGGDQRLWDSSIVIKNYTPGDFGLEFSQISSNASTDDKARIYSSYKPSPTDQVYMNGDPSQVWNGVTGNYFSPSNINGTTLAAELTAINAESQGGGVPISKPSPDGGPIAVAQGGSATIVDPDQTVVASGAGDSVSFGATGETASIGSGTVTLWNGAGAVVNGSDNTVDLLADTTVSVTGSGNTINAWMADSTITAGSSTLNVSDGASVSLTGDDDQVALGAKSTATVSGSNNRLAATGHGDILNFDGVGENVSTSFNTVNLRNGAGAAIDGDGNKVTLGSNTTLTANGSYDTVNVTGSGNRVAVDNATVKLSADAGGAVTGDDNTLLLYGAQSLTASGTNDSFVFQSAPAMATIQGVNASDTFQFSQSTFANWTQLLEHASQSGADTVIQTNATNTITLKDVALTSLDQNHFQFV